MLLLLSIPCRDYGNFRANKNNRDERNLETIKMKEIIGTIEDMGCCCCCCCFTSTVNI